MPSTPPEALTILLDRRSPDTMSRIQAFEQQVELRRANSGADAPVLLTEKEGDQLRITVIFTSRHAPGSQRGGTGRTDAFRGLAPDFTSLTASLAESAPVSSESLDATTSNELRRQMEAEFLKHRHGS